jgi:hypothetical protein
MAKGAIISQMERQTKYRQTKSKKAGKINTK